MKKKIFVMIMYLLTIVHVCICLFAGTGNDNLSIVDEMIFILISGGLLYSIITDDTSTVVQENKIRKSPMGRAEKISEFKEK